MPGMKISYDAEVDALNGASGKRCDMDVAAQRWASGREDINITFRETTVTTKHLAEGIAADYDSEGRLAGLEILDAKKRFGDAETTEPLGSERRGWENPRG